VNGVASGTTSFTGNIVAPLADFNLRIGRWGWDTAPRSFNGDIDEVRIYARSLSGGEVASAMAATHPCGASEPGAAHYLNVDEVTADNDASQISQPVTGAKDTQTYPGANVPAGAVVDSVSLRFAWKHDDTSHPSPAGPDMWALFRQNGADSRGPTYQSTNAAGWVSGQWNMTVNPRTGQAWTLADVNNGMEFGLEVYPTAGAWPHVTQTWVEVSYHTPSTSTVYIGGAYEKKSDGSVTKYYGALGEAIAVRQVPAGGGQGALYYLLADQLGSTSTLTDASGTVVATEKYWPYGAARSGGITQTDKLYTGQQIEPGDSALGLYNYKARFYSTVTGRFVSVDPIGGSPGGDPQAWNPYSYVRNNPVRYTDPTGKKTDTELDLQDDIRALQSLAKLGLDSPEKVWNNALCGASHCAPIPVGVNPDGTTIVTYVPIYPDAAGGINVGELIGDVVHSALTFLVPVPEIYFNYTVDKATQEIIDAAKGQRGFGGTTKPYSSTQAFKSGLEWTGPENSIRRWSTKDGIVIKSKDGLRQFRLQFKKESGRWEANLERRASDSGPFEDNFHLNNVADDPTKQPWWGGAK
jgi:RHS repeat-associated protein